MKNISRKLFLLFLPLLAFAQTSYIYYSFNDDPWTFNRRDTDGTNPVVIYTPAAFNVYDAAMDASIEKIYFHERSGDDSWIYQSNYDGSAKTTIKTSAAQYNSIAAGDGYIFYAYQDDPWSLRRCDANGANDIQLYLNPSSGSIHNIAYDAENDYLYCYEYQYINTNHRIFRIDNDGSNLTVVYNNCPSIKSITAGAGYFYFQCDDAPWNFSRRNSDGSAEILIYTPPTGAVRACAYDAINDKLYFYDYDGADNRYFYTSNPDGSSRSTFFSGFTQDINCVAAPCIDPAEVPLPITLTSFTAEALNGVVELAWRTASETDNARFIIYRDNEMIGSVDGAGTTSEPHNYSFVDNSVVPGVTYIYVIADISYANVETKYSDNAIAITMPENDIPTEFALKANYPNPFNPRTAISYSISAEATMDRQLSVVTLSIYDINGKKVATLVNGSKPAGYYSVKWDASNVSSGIYFYQLQAGNFVDIKKMVLMK